MSGIQPFTDPTGKMAPDEVNARNIAMIMQELNKATDQLSNSGQLTTYTDGSKNRYEIGYQTNGWGTGQNVGIKASKPGAEVTTATDSQLSYKDNFATKLYNNVNGVWTVLEGLRSANSTNGIGTDQYGFFVSKSGVDVTLATDAQLIFNSTQDVFKIIKTGTSTITPPPTWASYVAVTNTIPHGLSITPAFQAYVTIPVIGAGYPQEGKLVNFPSDLVLHEAANTGSTVWVQLSASTDSTNLYLTAYNAAGVNLIGYDTVPFVCRYYILQETAN